MQRSLQPGDVFTLTKFVTYHADRDSGPTPTLPAEGTGFDAVAAATAAAWEERWSTSEIEVDGDPDSQLALRFAAWSLAGAVSSTDPGAAAGARLLSGFGYRHHVFWDTDIFIIPYLTVTHPAAARNHIAYRFRGLPGARRKAEHYGREGAFFAWESADTGDEVTPEWTNSTKATGFGSGPASLKSTSWPTSPGRSTTTWIGPAMRTVSSTKERRSSSMAPATGPVGSRRTPTEHTCEG